MTKNNYYTRNGASYLKLENGEILLGYGELSNSSENFVLHSSLSSHFDYLVFMDSRGAKVEGKEFNSTVNLLKSYFDSSKLSYLIISRPLNLTTIPTLLSFFENTMLNFDNVITNVGFVDATPKKKDTLLDIKAQLEMVDIDYIYQYLCDFELTNGNIEELGTLSITNNSILDISARLKNVKSKIFFINTPEVSSNTHFERQRPKCFFSQIIKSNELIQKVCYESNGQLIDISKVGIETYDGVHFTEKGHNICHQVLLSSLAL